MSRQRTRLSPHQLRHGLSVLIQQHLVYWNTSLTDGSTAYEPNIIAAYNLVRNGKYVKITEDRFGKFAGSMMLHLLLLGHARVDDLVQAYGVGSTNEPKGKTDALRGMPNSLLPHKMKKNGRMLYEMQATLEKIHHTLRDLLQGGLISKAHKSDFRTDADNRIEAERLTPHIEEYKAQTKREREAMWEQAVQEKLDGWKYGTVAETRDIAALKKGEKRPLEYSNESTSEKRLRLDLTFSREIRASTGVDYQNSIMHSGYLNDDLVLRVNHAKFAVLMRSYRLVELAQHNICMGTSKLYEKVLHMVEGRLRACKDAAFCSGDEDETHDSFNPVITTEYIVSMIPESSELADAFGAVEDNVTEDEASDHPKKRHKKSYGGVEEVVVADDSGEYEGHGDHGREELSDVDTDGNDSEFTSDSDEAMGEADYNPAQSDLPALSLSPHHVKVRSHLLSLAQHPMGFLKHIPRNSSSSERWSINFRNLIDKTISQTINQIIASRYGILSVRLANILAERGKLDEKTLCSLCLVREKEMRTRLTTMHKAGLLELQEVPRDNARVASRTNFLFFFDQDRCTRRLLDGCYKTMTRLLERAAVEKEKVKGTLEKAGRSDVVGKEDELLSVPEREALQNWTDVQERICAQVGRVDDVVALLRDF
ncbi:MAG: hypothetical protein Q9217_006344 [Psora testacea]